MDYCQYLALYTFFPLEEQNNDTCHLDINACELLGWTYGSHKMWMVHRVYGCHILWYTKMFAVRQLHQFAWGHKWFVRLVSVSCPLSLCLLMPVLVSKKCTLSTRVGREGKIKHLKTSWTGAWLEVPALPCYCKTMPADSSKRTSYEKTLYEGCSYTSFPVSLKEDCCHHEEFSPEGIFRARVGLPW